MIDPPDFETQSHPKSQTETKTHIHPGRSLPAHELKLNFMFKFHCCTMSNVFRTLGENTVCVTSQLFIQIIAQ